MYIYIIYTTRIKFFILYLYIEKNNNATTFIKSYENKKLANFFFQLKGIKFMTISDQNLI